MFHSEIEALDWRVHELGQVVDDFVVVESRLTLSGRPRARVRPHRDPRFADIAGRLHVTIVKDPPEATDPRKRERHQRKAIWKSGVAKLSTAEDDLIIVSDVDEVPFPEIVDRLAFSKFDEPIFIRPHWFNFNWDIYLGPGQHPSIRVYTAGFLRRLFAAGRGGTMGRGIVPGRELDGLLGWHASWFGTDEMILDKLASYADAREARSLQAIADGAEGIRRQRASGTGMFGIGRSLGPPPRLPAHGHRLPGVTATGGPQPASEGLVEIESLPRRSSRRRVICGCTFHSELACLDWRLSELDAVVDDFVVIESVLTQSGQPREVVRPDLDPLFARFRGRFHGTVIEDPPTDPDPRVRAWTQRDAVWSRGAALLDPPDDALIIISDFDEVPFPEVVDRLAWSEFDAPLYVRPHWFNFSWATYLGPWMHPSIRFYTAGFLRRLFAEGRGTLVGRSEVPGREVAGLNGWHASWFGSDEGILDKLRSYSHVVEDRDQKLIAEGVEGIRRRRASGFDLFGIREVQGTPPRLPVHAHRFAGVSAIAGPRPALDGPVEIKSLPRRTSRRRVICGCTFHRELACLDWRLHELDAVVDDFVVVESVLTHAGRPRAIVRPDLDPLLARFRGRFHVTVIEDPPTAPDPWVRERSDREAVWSRGAALLDPPDDALVIISDFDEVPFPEVVDRLAWSDFDPPLCIRPHWFNFSWDTYLGPWMHPSIRIYTAGLLRRLFAEGHGALVGRNEVPGREIAGLNGWHASWFGSDEGILDKLRSYSHVEDERDRKLIAEGIEGIRRRRASGFDLFGIREVQGTPPRLPVHAHRFAGVKAAEASSLTP
jgi:beta-1,4-mannosyl-glycoprotein beta-1,4-N-acetylglucosaminyltransferase